MLLFTALDSPAAAGDAETSAPVVSAWNITTAIPLERVVIQSHRGAGALAAENTTAAFTLGWQLHTYPEGDIRTTTDGVIVTLHDADFKRVTKEVPAEIANRAVADVSWAEMQKIEVGEWKDGAFIPHKVPRVEQVFEMMQGHPERHLYLDIKNVKLPQLAKLVKQYHVERQVILAAPKHATIREWKTLVPESETLLWIRGTDTELEKQFVALRAANFEGITQVQVHTHLKLKPEEITRTTPQPFQESDELLVRAGEELRARGILFQTLPYGGTTREIYWKLLDLGLMSFATDYPDLCKDALAKYYASSKAPR
jgi:glycerophosphoryl diester phosphodiesterase